MFYLFGQNKLHIRTKVQKKLRLNGFTLVELLVVIVFIAILAGLAMPNFIGVQDKAKAASVRANMRTTQIAAESFGADNRGTYPQAPPSGSDLFSTYFPGGNSGGSQPGQPPINPFTNKSIWTDYISLTIANIPAERAKSPTAAAIAGSTPGQIGYAAVGLEANEIGPTAYAIEGADNAKNALSGTAQSTTLVLSNQ